MIEIFKYAAGDMGLKCSFVKPQALNRVHTCFLGSIELSGTAVSDIQAFGSIYAEQAYHIPI